MVSETAGARPTERFFELLESRRAQPGVFWSGSEISVGDVLRAAEGWRARLTADGLGAGSVVAVHGEFSPQTIALIFALMQSRAIVVPLCSPFEAEIEKLLGIAGVEGMYRVDRTDRWTFERKDVARGNALIERFRERLAPGLVVFTSGSTGEPKGILHDCDNVLSKFLVPRPPWRTVLFLLMDHFGGLNTLFSTFAYGGTAVCLLGRAPREVMETVQASRATLLPTTPTFLNLVLAAQAHRGLDLSSVRMITYGTEVMPEATLRRLAEVFPSAQLKQTYGLSETGVLRSSSKSNDSLWMRVGGDGFETKVVDDVLWVRATSNMIGYLNAPSPFDDEGWLCTGDRVEVDGEYIRVLGRNSEMINVGGQKVFPAEVENVLLAADNVVEATVFGSKHALMGNIVHARVALATPEALDVLTPRLRAHCAARLARFKVPVRFEIISAADQRGERFKKARAK